MHNVCYSGDMSHADQTSLPAVLRLDTADAPDVIAVFCDAFFDYPVFRYVLRDAGADYPRQLQMLITLFVTARVLRNEQMFGVRIGDRLAAAATTSIPDNVEPSEAFTAMREATWAALGRDTRARYEDCVQAWTPLAVNVPQIHVNMIGVRAAQQRTGLAGQILRAIHEYSLTTPPSQGVTLTTEDPRNVSFYEHLGYHIVGQGRIGEQMDTWGFFRPN